MELDIYDFDKTMFPRDSGSLFFLYELVHHPALIRFLPDIAIGLVEYLSGKDLTTVKSRFFSYVKAIDTAKESERFWDKYESRIYPRVRKENRERYSVIVSASPEFLIKEISTRLSMDAYICTLHDEKGAVIGKNCHDEEKVRRFREVFPDAQVNTVYSDSEKNDVPLFSLGKNCVLVRKGSFIPFVFEEKYPEYRR